MRFEGMEAGVPARAMATWCSRPAPGTIEHHANMLRGLAPVMVAAGLVDGEGEPKYAAARLPAFLRSWCINRRSEGGLELPPKRFKTLLGHSSIVMTHGHLRPSVPARRRRRRAGGGVERRCSLERDTNATWRRIS